MYPEQVATSLKESDAIKRRLEEPKAKLKSIEKQIGKELGSRKDTAQEEVKSLLEEAAAIRQDLDEAELGLSTDKPGPHERALSLPNLTSPKTPRDQQRLVSYINHDPNERRTFPENADHALIGQRLSLLDFRSASTTAGWGFYYLKNEAALLEQALVQYAIAVAMRHGWRPVSPPSLVYSHIADACGFQPRDQNDEKQIWQIAQAEKEEYKPARSLAATAEIPLAGLYASQSIREEDLPVKLVGSSRCYRAEAGARGVDTKGLYRVHEFTKVEMFAWTESPKDRDVDVLSPEWTKHSAEVFDEMVKIQIQILSSLGLPCRVLEMPSTDLGASAYRKIDMEALFPSRMSRDDGWGEVTSASICTDYQSRRLDTRILESKGTKSRFPHTVNGTAIAVPRTLAAILEHGWREEEGVVVVPKVLRPYMAGIEKIGPAA